MTHFTTRLSAVLFALFATAAVNAGELDLNKPEDAVKAARKLFASLKDGEAAVYYWEGKIYGRRPGERDKLLFTYVAMSHRAATTQVKEGRGYGYKMVSRELLFYMDPKTGEVLDTWSNPYSGKDVEVVHVANDPVNHSSYAHSKWGDYSWDGTFKDGVGWLTFEIPLYYPNPLGGDYQKYVGNMYQAIEMFNFFFDEKKLKDADTNTVDDAIISWSRVSQWLPWMEMGSIAGQLIYNGYGKRLHGYDDLPQSMRTRIEKDYPAWTSPPKHDDPRRNMTSWSAFKKHIDAKRETAKDQ